MYFTTKTVEVNNVTPILTKDYQKVVFNGTEENDKGKPTGGDPETLLAETIEFFKTKFDGDETKAVLEILDHVTYAYDLEVRNSVRAELTSGGPEKAIERQIKAYMQGRERAGKPVTEAVARKRVLALMAMESEEGE